MDYVRFVKKIATNDFGIKLAESFVAIFCFGQVGLKDCLYKGCCNKNLNIVKFMVVMYMLG